MSAPSVVASASTRRERWSWYLYDFGNSAYASVVILAVYSAYFKTTVVGGAEGSRLWGLAIGVAMLAVALMSPVLGVIADYTGSKKRFLFFFTALAVAFTAGLSLAGPGAIALGMGFFILAEIGYRAAQVFYDALLPEIAHPDDMGRVSGIGWAVGTLGGIVILLLIQPILGAQPGDAGIHTAMIVTAVFYALAATPIFLWLPERARGKALPPGEGYLRVALKQLKATVLTSRRFREFFKFILAYLIYNDGVMMALDFAAIIGAVLFGMTTQQLVTFVIIIQVTNVIGALVFGWLVDRIGAKRSLIIAILLMIGLVLALYVNQTQTGFLLIGAGAGFAMAGIQSVSRTAVALFAPPGQSAEFYGLFAVAGRTSSFIGPTVYGILAAEAALWLQASGQAAALAEQGGQRIAILSIAVFLLVGLGLLLLVDEKKAGQASREAAPAQA